MTQRSLLATLATVLVAQGGTIAAAPEVSNVSASQQATGDRAVQITYDLAGGSVPMIVSLLVSNDNGATFNIVPEAQHLSGNVGQGIMNGTGYSIVWDAMADVPEIFWPQTRVRVIAVEQQPTVPLLIESNAASSVHRLATQTLTFTFDEPVTGFDATDVTVVGATKGSFSGSGAVYTLEVTSSGGSVTVSVPENLTVPGNIAANFFNFYQDTWTLMLPGDVPMELIRIPAGSFAMGSPAGEVSREADETLHDVTISEDFYLGKTGVTQAQWLAVAGSWPGTAPSANFGVGDNHPAYNVSHNDCVAFMASLDAVIAQPGSFSLPTEAQREYAARAGTSTRFSFGDGLHPSNDENCGITQERDENVWFCGNNGSFGNPDYGTKPVGSKLANAWGLHDMHGSLFEWCADWYGGYLIDEEVDPLGPDTGTMRVMRGGGWGSAIDDTRAARRGSNGPGARNPGAGLRVAATR